MKKCLRLAIIPRPFASPRTSLAPKCRVQGKASFATGVGGALLVLAAAFGAFSVSGQSAIDGFDPDTAGAPVQAIALHPHSRIILVGEFTTVSGIFRCKIARLRVATVVAAASASNRSVRQDW